MDAQRMRKIEMNSLMGAVAGFVLLQAMAVLLFEGMVMLFVDPGIPHELGARGFFIVWGLVWVLVFLILQTALLNDIEGYVRQRSRADVLQAVTRPSEWLKLLCAIGAAYLYWAIIARRVPISHRQELHGAWIVVCHVLSWGASGILFAAGRRLGIPASLQRGHMAVVLIMALLACAGMVANYMVLHSIHLGVALLAGFLVVFAACAVMLEYPRNAAVADGPTQGDGDAG